MSNSTDLPDPMVVADAAGLIRAYIRADGQAFDALLSGPQDTLLLTAFGMACTALVNAYGGIDEVERRLQETIDFYRELNI